VFCEDNNIDIIISSSWREIHTLDELKTILVEEGFMNTDRIIGKAFTEDKTKYVFRGYEIEEWLAKQSINYNYVILDDTPDFLNYQKERVVLTDFNEGLDIIHLRRY